MKSQVSNRLLLKRQTITELNAKRLMTIIGGGITANEPTSNISVNLPNVPMDNDNGVPTSQNTVSTRICNP